MQMSPEIWPRADVVWWRGRGGRSLEYVRVVNHEAESSKAVYIPQNGGMTANVVALSSSSLVKACASRATSSQLPNAGMTARGRPLPCPLLVVENVFDSNTSFIFCSAFCDAFRDAKPIDEILGHLSPSSNIIAFEHGLPQLAPFLGRTFSGVDGVKKYFETISSLLKYEDMRFSDFVVDAEAHKASMKGNARFTWISTGQSWDEVFTYALEFDTEGKIKKYDVWADSGAAYLASKGEL